MWHSVSCWIMDPVGLHVIKAAIRGFIWSGKDNPMDAARVSWCWLTQPRAKGGLGLIDPLMQSCALLAKMVVRCVLPGKGCWKVLLRNRLLKNISCYYFDKKQSVKTLHLPNFTNFQFYDMVKF